jgi:hypothetical protein
LKKIPHHKTFEHPAHALGAEPMAGEIPEVTMERRGKCKVEGKRGKEQE